MWRLAGREGYWAWVLHRASGLGVLLFLALHIVDIGLVNFGPDVFNYSVATLYRNPLARVGEVLLVAAVVYHAANGLRIIAVDVWDGASRYQRQLWYAVWGLFLALFGPAAVLMLRPLFGPA